jgi:hypothetical protein
MCYANFTREIPNGIPQKEGHLENGQKLKCLWKLLTFEKYFDLGRPPTRIRPHEKSLYFSTWVSLVTTRPLLKQKSLYFFTFSFFHLGRSSIIMRPSMKNPCIFQKKEKKNLSLYFSPSERSLGTMRPIARFLAFYHRASLLWQWDHLRASSYFIIR